MLGCCTVFRSNYFRTTASEQNKGVTTSGRLIGTETVPEAHRADGTAAAGGGKATGATAAGASATGATTAGAPATATQEQITAKYASKHGLTCGSPQWLINLLGTADHCEIICPFRTTQHIPEGVNQTGRTTWAE